MGEDPYLAAKIVVPYIKGVQQNGVAACVKHFALNNQSNGGHINVEVSDELFMKYTYLLLKQLLKKENHGL